MFKPIYRRFDHWVLGVCTLCGRLNYVEPHGTTARCKCSAEWTEHKNIPQRFRCGMASDRYFGPARLSAGDRT